MKIVNTDTIYDICFKKFEHSKKGFIFLQCCDAFSCDRYIFNGRKSCALNSTILNFTRYQWSVGFTDHDVPVGIFDPEYDRVWHDAGQQDFVVFTTKPGRYSFYNIQIRKKCNEIKKCISVNKFRTQNQFL